ncbi:MAG: LapA family protein [Alteromonadaceae bacterium]|nr:LapA family protein [Alteromonadaceae bacterium]
MRIYLTLIFVFILIAIAFVFASQNSQMMTLNYLIAQEELSVASAVSIFTLLGFILGLLVALMGKLLTVIKPKRVKNDIKVIV